MPDFMVFAAILPRLVGAKVVLDMHDLMPDLYAVKFDLDRAGWGVQLLRGVQTVSAAFADAVICVHEPQYELLLRDGVPPRKLNIVMNAADPKLFAPRKKEPRIKSEGGEVRVVYHGTILHRYGVDIAVRAFAKAREREPRLRLSILGDGDFLPEVERIAAGLGLDPDVLYLSRARLPLSEVAERIRDAHIGIIPVRDDQEDSVLPTKLLEYISVGIPSIATRTRCISRYFDDTQVELVAVEDEDAMADALVRLAQDKTRRKALVDAARVWEEEFGYETQMRLLFRVVDSLCIDKILADKRAKQAAEEGKKTGSKKTPPKPKTERVSRLDDSTSA
jgi:glycosyltransferase involved in cell wall biosynthesis